MRFILVLPVAIVGLYLAHHWAMRSFFPKKDLEFLQFSYKFNLGITLLFTSTLMLVGKKMQDQIGFIFLAEGMVKIGLFLYLTKTLQIAVDKSNLIDFFLPYLGCLLVELFFVLRILKQLDANNDK